jgi:hypothetical protein
MKKTISAILLFFFCSASAFAQGVFDFSKTEHDFGDIVEGVNAKFTFTFKNTGNAPIVMTNVNASCGCTTPEWTREPVLPGETGSITAIYSSANRPGAFAKSITITSNASEPSKMLKIKGMVVKGEHGEGDGHNHGTAEMYKDQPEISFAEASVNYGKHQRGQALTKEFKFTNTGKSDLVIEKVKSNCNCITHSVSAAVVKPGQSGVLKVVYRPLAVTNKAEVITVHTNNKNGKTASIILNGEVVDSLTEGNMLREQDKSVPFK